METSHTTNKKGFVLYKDFSTTLDKLSDEQAGRVIKAIFEWQLTGVHSEDDFTLDLVLTPVIAQFVRDQELYDKTCKRNKVNGLKGGRPKNPTKPKKPSGLNGNPSKPKKADTKEDTVIDIEKDSDNKSIPPSSDEDDQFNQFWAIYPKKQSKLDARKKFVKAMKIATLPELLESLNKQKLSLDWTKDGGRYIPQPSTWLNKGMWLDEESFDAPATTKKAFKDLSFEEKQAHFKRVAELGES